MRSNFVSNSESCAVTGAAETTGRMKPYRGRIAPTPTGYLHLGHAQTFWSATQRARRAEGTLIYRTEDLDPQRCKAEYSQAAMEDLRWIGIDWDEGPEKGGDYGPYRQSERKDMYREYAETLIEKGHAFKCYRTADELNELRHQLKIYFYLSMILQFVVSFSRYLLI